jgi:hypothetical protein
VLLIHPKEIRVGIVGEKGEEPRRDLTRLRPRGLKFRVFAIGETFLVLEFAARQQPRVLVVCLYLEPRLSPS